jgi:hypothetical protein
LAPGEHITKITEVDRSMNKYEIVYRTHKKKNKLLQWLLGSLDVEKAEIEP